MCRFCHVDCAVHLLPCSLNYVRCIRSSYLRNASFQFYFSWQGVTCTTSLTCPPKANHVVLDPVIWRATSTTQSPPVRFDESSRLADAYSGVHVQLFKSGEVCRLVGSEVYSSYIKKYTSTSFYLNNKELCVLHLQSNMTIIHPLVQ